MPLTTGAFPFDLDNALGGRARVLISDLSDVAPVAVPTKIHDVIETVYPYPAQTGWVDLGLTLEGASYGRSFTEEGWEYQQAQSALLSEITGVARSATVSIAEIHEDTLAMIEQSPGIETIAAKNGVSIGQKAVPFGEISDLGRFRVALIAQRKKQSGVVKEPVADGGRERGRFVAILLNQAAVAADETGMGFEKGSPSAIATTFTVYNEDGEDFGEEHGRHVMEDAGTIAAGP
jgi:hypothetical protein